MPLPGHPINGQSRFRPPFLIATWVPALTALLARNAEGLPLIHPWVSNGAQVPLLAVLGLAMVRPPQMEGRPFLSKTDRLLSLAVIFLGIVIAAAKRSADPLFLATTSFVTGVVLIEQLAALTCRFEQLARAPREALRAVLKPWGVMVLGGTVLLALPLATQSSVPDYKYNFWLHVGNCAQSAVSAACLVGTSPYSFAEDFTSFGRCVLLTVTQLAGLGFLAIGWSIFRPLLNQPPAIRTVWTVALALQLLGIAIIAIAIPAARAPVHANAFVWAAVHATSAIWNTGWTLDARELTESISIPAVFATLTTLSICGSLGLPLLISLIRGEQASGTRLIPFWRRLSVWEALTTLVLLVLGAGFIFLFETPRFCPPAFVPERPVDFGSDRVCIRDDLPGSTRWTMSLFLSATSRSTGFQITPMSEGAVSWPTYGLVMGLMFLGGSAGGIAGGVGVTSIVLLAISLLPRASTYSGYSLRPAITWACLRVIASMLILDLLCIIALSLTTDSTAYERVFESTAATGGVGLSTGLSLHLTGGARLVIIATLVAGRLLPIWIWTGLAQRLGEFDVETSASAPVAIPLRAAHERTTH